MFGSMIASAFGLLCFCFVCGTWCGIGICILDIGAGAGFGGAAAAWVGGPPVPRTWFG